MKSSSVIAGIAAKEVQGVVGFQTYGVSNNIIKFSKEGSR